MTYSKQRKTILLPILIHLLHTKYGTHLVEFILIFLAEKKNNYLLLVIFELYEPNFCSKKGHGIIILHRQAHQIAIKFSPISHISKTN